MPSDEGLDCVRQVTDMTQDDNVLNVRLTSAKGLLDRIQIWRIGRKIKDETTYIGDQ